MSRFRSTALAAGILLASVSNARAAGTRCEAFCASIDTDRRTVRLLGRTKGAAGWDADRLFSWIESSCKKEARARWGRDAHLVRSIRFAEGWDFWVDAEFATSRADCVTDPAIPDGTLPELPAGGPWQP